MEIGVRAAELANGLAIVLVRITEQANGEAVDSFSRTVPVGDYSGVINEAIERVRRDGERCSSIQITR